MRVYSGQCDATIVHLSCEYLVSKEIVTENTTVTVWAVNTFVPGHIWEVTNHSMHTIVLLLNIVQMSCVSLDVVVAKNALKN